MARLNLTIPDELKRRIDEASDQNVNWSAVAAKAFEAKLAEFITRKGAKDMKDVITRLRASKAKTLSRDCQERLETGRQWARNDADYEDLRNLARAVEPLMSRGEWETSIEDDDRNSAYSVAEWVAFQIFPENEGDRHTAADFWERQLGSQDPTKGEVDGFVRGALEIWDEVKDQI